MHFSRLAQQLRIPAIALFSILLASCGSGDGGSSVDAAAADAAASKFRMVFRDDFGGPAVGPKVAAKIPPAPLEIGNWVVDTGYGANGWGNDEWQRYDNSMENLFTEDGNLVIRAKCAAPPACGKRDGTITSAKVITKDRLNVKYGSIRARIKMPSGLGMWPAFWTLGSDIDERPWPDAGELDIVEMHYFYSDTRTTHFSTHWSGPKYTPENRPVCASGVGSSLDPAEEENCKTISKTFDNPGDVPLTDDFHVYEMEWNESTITGKIDGITYFTQAIDISTMEEFLKDHFLILNVAVGGTLGGPFGPAMSAADWADTDQTDMLVDWVEVYEKVTPTQSTLIDESGNNLSYIRIANSAEFGGGFVESDLDSTAVTPLVGSTVLELTYSNSVSENGGVPALFSTATFLFSSIDLSDYTKLVFSIDTSQFPGLAELVLELKDNRFDVANGVFDGKAVTSVPVADSDNWQTFEVLLSEFVGANLDEINELVFGSPLDANGNILSGTLFIDDIRFVKEECVPNPNVAFDSVDYNPATRIAEVTVSDACAASSLANVKIETGTDEIFVGVELDAAGNGSTIFDLLDADSVCSTSDADGFINLSSPLMATYSRTYFDNAGTEQFYSAFAMAGIDPSAPGTTLTGEKSYIYASSEPIDFIPDTDFFFSDFSTGSQFDGNVTTDPTFSPVFSVSNGANTIGVLALFDFNAGFAANADSINFKVKDMPNNAIEVRFGDPATGFSVDLQTYSGSTAIGGGWYEVSVPMSEFPDVGQNTFVQFTSDNSSAAFTYLITDIFLAEKAGNAPAECENLVVPPPPAISTLGLYSETNTNPVLAYSSIINGADFGGNQTIADENSTAVTPFDGSVSLSIDFQNTGSTYGGAIFDIGGGDVSANDRLRFAIDTSAVASFADLVVQLEDGAAFSVFLSAYTPTMSNNWAVYDIPLADFGGVNLANITLIGFWNMSSTAGSVTLTYGTIYLDDIHFASTTPPPPSGDTLGLYSETNTNPVLAYSSIINGADFGGNQTIADENSTAVTPFDGSVSLSIDFQNTGSTYGGAIFDIGGGDVSANDRLRFAIDTSAVASFADLVVQLEDGAAFSVFLSAYTPTMSNNWAVYDIPLADFGGVNLANITLIGFWNMSSTAGSVTLTYGTIYLDDIHFASTTPPPPSGDTLGLYSETNTNPVLAYSSIINGADFGGNQTIADENSTAVTPFDGSVSLSVDFQDTGQTYGGAIFDIGGGDVSAYDRLRFAIDTSAVASFADLVVQLEDGAAFSVFLSAYTPTMSGNWAVYDIPLADFGGVNLANITLIGFWNMSSTAGSVTLTYGTIYLDDIHFAGSAPPPPPPPPPGGNLAVNGGFETGDFTGTVQFENGGTQSITAVNPSSGTYSANLNVVTPQADTVLKFANLTPGAFTPGQTIFISFDMRGELAPGGVAFAEFFSELSGGGTSSAEILFGGGPIFPDANPDMWTNFSTTAVTGSDTSGGITLQLKGATGGGNLVDLYFDNVCISTSACPTTPPPPPPPPPSSPLGLYSETNTSSVLPYTQIINGADFGGNQTIADENSTAVTPFEGSLVLSVDFQDTGQTYGGAIFDIGGGDVSAYDRLRFAIDTSAVPSFADLVVQLEDGAAFSVFLSAYTPTMSNNWAVYDIPLADFGGVNLANITLVGFWNMSSTAGSVTLTYGTVYLDDIHFAVATPPPPPPPGNTLGVYSETNTSSVLPYTQIINGADFGGNQTIADENSTAVTPFDGSVSLSIDFQDTGQTYGGAIFDFGGGDVSAYTHLKFAIDTSAVASFGDLVVQLEDGAAFSVFLSAYTPTMSNNWAVYEIPLADFGGVNLANITLLGFWNLSSTVGSVTLTYGIIYLDDIHFLGSVSPPSDPTLGLYSETNTNPVLAYSSIINGADFGGNQTIADENSTAVTPFDGSVSLSVDFQDTGQTYGGAIFDIGGGDVSAYDRLRFAIDTSAVASFADLVVQLEDGAAFSVFLSAYTPTMSNNWAVYDIPLADFGGVNLANITLIGFWNMSSTAGSVTLTYGTIYLDDIHFAGSAPPPPPPPPPGGNLAVNGGFETGDFTGTVQFENGGTQSITAVNPSSGTYSANLNVVTPQADTVLKFANLTPGAFTPGQTIFISFDMRGELAPGGVAFAEFFSELSGGGTSSAEILFGGGPIFPDANPDMWTNFSTTAVTGSDTSGGITLQLKGATGGGNLVDLYFDNVCVSTSACP